MALGREGPRLLWVAEGKAGPEVKYPAILTQSKERTGFSRPKIGRYETSDLWFEWSWQKGQDGEFLPNQRGMGQDQSRELRGPI